MVKNDPNMTNWRHTWFGNNWYAIWV